MTGSVVSTSSLTSEVVVVELAEDPLEQAVTAIKTPKRSDRQRITGLRYWHVPKHKATAQL